jgi:hypothetical protein
MDSMPCVRVRAAEIRDDFHRIVYAANADAVSGSARNFADA